MKLILSELVADLTADIRSSPTYFAPCPLCSFLNGQMPMQIIGPSAYRARHDDRWRITRCCALSKTDESFAIEAQAAGWWSVRRRELRPDLATANRQALTLERLSAANLDSI